MRLRGSKDAAGKSRRLLLGTLVPLACLCLVSALNFIHAGHGISAEALGLHSSSRSQPQCEDRPPNVTLSARFVCTVLDNACLDQGRVILHSGQKTPGHPAFVGHPLFELRLRPPVVLPGYDEPLGTAHYEAPTNVLDIRGPSPTDPPDVRSNSSDAFDACHQPFVFWPWYMPIYGDFYVHTLMAIHGAWKEGLITNRTQFVPMTHGMEPPPYYATHLAAFSPLPVESMASLSSRERPLRGVRRCFRHVTLCDLPAKTRQPGSIEELALIGGLSAWETAQAIVAHYKAAFPAKFQPRQDTQTFKVGFISRQRYRQFHGLQETLAACNAWTPPTSSKYSRTECKVLPPLVAASQAAFADDLALLQGLDALVVPHGSHIINGFFLRPGRGLVEVIPYDFCGIWPDSYYKSNFEKDISKGAGYVRVVADSDHVLPGPWQRNDTGSRTAWKRDQDTKLEWEALETALSIIAAGRMKEMSDKERTIPMQREQACPQ